MKYVLFWLAFIPIAIANGIFRENVLLAFFNPLLSHQLSTLSFILIFGTIAWLFFKRWPTKSFKEALWIGLLWLVLTVGFEFLFGHYIAGHSWQKLFADYNILEGRIWILVLLWIFSSPMMIFALKKMDEEF